MNTTNNLEKARQGNSEVIYSYTKEQAIEDGVLTEVGRMNGRGIVFTANLITKLGKAALLSTLIEGLKKVRAFSTPDMATIEINGEKIWVDDNGADITFMLPEDY